MNSVGNRHHVRKQRNEIGTRMKWLEFDNEARIVQQMYVGAFFRHIWDHSIDVLTLNCLRTNNVGKGGL